MHRARNTQIPEEENPFWISFSDLMSGLLILFIMATLVLILELTEATRKIESRTQELNSIRHEVARSIYELAKSEQIRREVLREILDELQSSGIQVEVSDNETILRIPSDVLAFESNEYDIPDSSGAKSVIEKIGEVIHSRLLKSDRYQHFDTIFIEGHTDSRRSRRELGNWGLSTFRAISVWKWWEDNLQVSPSLAVLRNTEGHPLFSVSGYAATRRVQLVEETADQLEINRRIDIRFTVRRPKIESYKEINKLLDLVNEK